MKGRAAASIMMSQQPTHDTDDDWLSALGSRAASMRARSARLVSCKARHLEESGGRAAGWSDDGDPTPTPSARRPAPLTTTTRTPPPKGDPSLAAPGPTTGISFGTTILLGMHTIWSGQSGLTTDSNSRDCPDHSFFFRRRELSRGGAAAVGARPCRLCHHRSFYARPRVR
eukprot:COSAG01_NODE_1436_length_10312_cov_12.469500_5_plen_171_part_00